MFREPASKSVVLYVDDDADDILLVKESLERYPNIELISFTDSHAFLKYIIDSKPFQRLPSLILIDINMPQLNGRELLAMLRSYEQLRKVSIVLYSTSQLNSDNHFAKSLDASFVTKPSSISKLDQLIDEILLGCGVRLYLTDQNLLS